MPCKKIFCVDAISVYLKGFGRAGELDGHRNIWRPCLGYLSVVLSVHGSFSCGMPATSVKLFVFLFVCGVSLSEGSLIDTMTDLQSSAIPSTTASTNVTEDTCFSIKFETKQCGEKQKMFTEKVASYFTKQANALVHAVQPGSNSQNGLCLNVFVRAAKSYKKDSARRAISRLLKSQRDVSIQGEFTIYITACDPSQSHVLDQSVGQDPSDKSKNLPCVTTFAAALASGTNSGIHDSGDQ